MANHCLKCGIVLELRLLAGREREVCCQCGWVYYPQLKVGAGVLIEKDNCLLLLQRAHEPWLGDWNLPAGYVDADENPLNAAKREAMEETGLNVEIKGLAEVCYFDDDPRGSGVFFVYDAKSISGQFKIDNESYSVRYVSWENIPENLAGGGHNQAIRGWRLRAQRQYGR
jgi:8-oxo-dGTP diphosphatase